jgi:predicted nucleic acid-binding protein
MLKGDAGVKLRHRQAIGNGDNVVIPPVVFYEVRRGLLARRMNKRLAEFGELCQTALKAEFDMPVWRRAAEIYARLHQQGRPIGEADNLVAAFCLVNGYTLVTNNECHFGRVDGLKMVNWKQTFG